MDSIDGALSAMKGPLRRHRHRHCRRGQRERPPLPHSADTDTDSAATTIGKGRNRKKRESERGPNRYRRGGARTAAMRWRSEWQRISGPNSINMKAEGLRRWKRERAFSSSFRGSDCRKETSSDILISNDGRNRSCCGKRRCPQSHHRQMARHRHDDAAQSRPPPRRRTKGGGLEIETERVRPNLLTLTLSLPQSVRLQYTESLRSTESLTAAAMSMRTGWTFSRK